jgi:HEAT repeat protein
VQSLPEGHGAAVLLTDPTRALPMLKRAYQQSQGDEQLVYARALATLGDNTGVDTLIEALEQAEKWDRGWNYKGMGQFGSALSELDVLIIQLGLTKDPRALPVILEKVALLDGREDFSHHRAVGLALESLSDPAAAKPLAELLGKERMTGYVHADLATATELGSGGGTNAERTRRESLRELVLARALYRCGDHDGLGRRILESYTQDLRGHLARHAQAVLSEAKD